MVSFTTALVERKGNLGCPVGHGIKPALDQVYDKVNQALRSELTRTSIADVLRSTLAVR